MVAAAERKCGIKRTRQVMHDKKRFGRNARYLNSRGRECMVKRARKESTQQKGCMAQRMSEVGMGKKWG
jgi:hypothetical protein